MEVTLKQLVSALCLALVPMTASAEAGAQLTAWAASSRGTTAQQTETAPTPTPANDTSANPTPAPQPSDEAKVEATEQKLEEKQTVVATTTPEQLASISGLSVNASFDSYLGQGTFFNSALYASLASSFYIAGRYSFKVGGTKLAVSGTGYVSYEYTLPDAPNGRRWTWRDLGFGVSAPAILKDTKFSGISMTPSLSFTVPITPESWNATTITVLGAGLNFTRSIGLFDLALSFGGSRGFHRLPINAVASNGSVDAQGNQIVLCRAGENVCGMNNINTAWGFSTAATVDFRATENLSFSAQYVIRIGWRYPTVPGNDPYTSKAQTENGQNVADTGSVRAPDLVITSIGANYQFSDHWGISIYTYTAMPPRTADGKSLRFPFWDFTAGPMNYSALGLSLSASF